MSEYFLGILRGGISRFVGVTKKLKSDAFLVLIILMLFMSVFFWSFSAKFAQAQKSSDAVDMQVIFKPEYVTSIIELRDIEFIAEDEELEHCENNNAEVVADEAEDQPERIQMQPIGDIIIEKLGFAGELEEAKAEKEAEKYCDNTEKAEVVDVAEIRKENRIFTMVANHPIEEMIPFISKRSDMVAYYLVAIAKKESDWGKHSPQKNGGTCYNYWGYRGSYNRTDSGYSCFDSPEHAVQTVGDKIEKLVNQKIDTPEELIVWKCGSTCAGHDPQGVLKWISDVKLYYGKLNT